MERLFGQQIQSTGEQSRVQRALRQAGCRVHSEVRILRVGPRLGVSQVLAGEFKGSISMYNHLMKPNTKKPLRTRPISIHSIVDIFQCVQLRSYFGCRWTVAKGQTLTKKVLPNWCENSVPNSDPESGSFQLLYRPARLSLIKVKFCSLTVDFHLLKPVEGIAF